MPGEPRALLYGTDSERRAHGNSRRQGRSQMLGAEMDAHTPLQINILNKAMMSVDVPAGEHVIRMYYDRRDCKIAFVIQCAVALLALVLIVVIRRKTHVS